MNAIGGLVALTPPIRHGATAMFIDTAQRGLAQHVHPHVARCSPSRIRVAAASLQRAHGKLWPGPVQTRSQGFQSTSTSRDSEPRRSTSWLLRRSSVRVSTLFTALLGLGAGAIALGLYDIYTSFTLWPVELRNDLRAGIRARNDGDHALSERFLARAYQTALSLPLAALGPDPYLKLSGIAAVLAEVAPERRAKDVLRSVWDLTDARADRSVPSAFPERDAGYGRESEWAAYTLADEERLRRVAVACKLAELSAHENGGQAEEERWLVWAVEEALRLAGVQTDRERVSTPVVLAELNLPTWMRRADLGAPLAALGAVYARKGDIEYAMPLYLQAISLLVPPNTENVSVEDRCMAAQLMNNLSELIMRRPPSPEIRHQAEAWARQAHGLIGRVQEVRSPRRGWISFSTAGGQNTEVCDQALGVVLFNLGLLREMDNDHTAARSLYEQSLWQCEKVGMTEGVVQTKQALRRLGGGRAGVNAV